MWGSSIWSLGPLGSFGLAWRTVFYRILGLEWNPTVRSPSMLCCSGSKVGQSLNGLEGARLPIPRPLLPWWHPGLFSLPPGVSWDDSGPAVFAASSSPAGEPTMGVVLSTIYTENFKCVSTNDETNADTKFIILSRTNTEIVTIDSDTESDSGSKETI